MTALTDDLIYLDYNATTPVASEVIEAMEPYWREKFGNPSSSHRYGQAAREAVEFARSQVASFVGVSPDWVIFTGGATEANNLALLGAAHRMPADKRHLVVSAVEHPAVMEPAKALQRAGWNVSIAPVDQYGRIRLGDFAALLRDDTSIVSVMHTNNEVGTIQPIAEISRLTKARGILLHTDAAQSVGKVPVSAYGLGVDMLTLAGHKFYAPKGVGALIRNPKVGLAPLDYGAGHEHGLRPGTENVPLIVGLGVAARLAAESLTQREQHMRRMVGLLHALLAKEIPGLQLNGHLEHRLPNTLNVSLPDCEAKAVLAQLGDVVAASAGSACHSDSAAVSGVLGAMGIDARRAAGAIRLSVGVETTEQDIQQAAHHLAKAWAHLRQP